MTPHHIRIEFDDHMMWERPSIRGLIVPGIVPASREHLTPRAKRSLPSGSGKRLNWLDVFEKATMAERLNSVWQTAAFSLSATSPCVDVLRILRIRVAENGYGRRLWTS